MCVLINQLIDQLVERRTVGQHWRNRYSSVAGSNPARLNYFRFDRIKNYLDLKSKFCNYQSMDSSVGRAED